MDKVSGKTLLNKLKIDLGTDFLPIIAEDLGVITPDVEKLRKYFELPGMKILQFALMGTKTTHIYQRILKEKIGSFIQVPMTTLLPYHGGNA